MNGLLHLNTRIQDRSARLAVIGLGYVGLPVAALFAQKGFDVTGVEIRCDRVEMINRGVSPIDGEEPGLPHLLQEVVSAGKLRATCDYEDLRDRDVVLIDVETPVDDERVPRYEALRASLLSLGPVLKEGALVIVESTIAPGTMQKLVLPLLKQTSGKDLNEGFYLGNCPERVMPGKLLANLRSLSRVVGGATPETSQAMAALYSTIVDADLDAADWVTAELVKTVENTYRDVQIAFANEVALICENTGADIWRVRELVNKSPSRNLHLPGAGVGGHCIPKDPWLLAYGVKDTGLGLNLIPAARGMNDYMPTHMVDLLTQALGQAGKSLLGARILVMGYAYLENSDDTRNSPSEVFVARLKELGAQAVVHDPIVPEYSGDVYAAASGCHAAVLMVAHKAYHSLDLERLKDLLILPVLVDGRGLFTRAQAEAAGLFFRGVGVGA